jgi:hypothetical protein
MSLLNASSTSAKFPTIGTRVGGRVVKDAEEMQQRDFDSGDLLFWDDGNPRMQLVVTVDTGQSDPDDPEDDGERAIYIKGQALAATRQACKKAKKFVIEENDFFAMTFVSEEPLPKGKKGNKKKVYEVEFRPADGRESDLLKPSMERAAVRAASDDKPPF